MTPEVEALVLVYLAEEERAAEVEPAPPTDPSPPSSGHTDREVVVEVVGHG